jgi:hypothetical protein
VRPGDRLRGEFMPIIHREALGSSRPTWCDVLIGEVSRLSAWCIYVILIQTHIVERVTTRGYEQEFLLSTCLMNSAEMHSYIAGSNIAACRVQTTARRLGWRSPDAADSWIDRAPSPRRLRSMRRRGQSIMIAHHSRRTQASAPHQNQCNSTLT